MSNSKVVHCIVSGLVQGVFYRASTKDMADSLNLTGWVRNIPDGKVELQAFGNPDNIQKLVDWLWKGPSAAKVSNVEVNYIDIQEEFRDFSIKY